MARHPISREAVGDNDPLRLDVAAAIAFPDGSMTASGLRRESAKGRLAVERIAGKDFTTLQAIREMRERCRVNPKALDCGSNPSGETMTARSANGPFGLSETERARSARARLQKIARARSKPCTITLRTNTSQAGSVAVVPSKS